MSNAIESWFDKYLLVIVPVDSPESPIQRWRTDVVSSDIKNSPYWIDADGTSHLGGDLDGKELTFLGEKRPVSRFLYFHFVMALVRIKDLGRQGWQNV